MRRGIAFGESKRDKDLIRRIEEFRVKKEITSFTEAVRILCNDALQLKEISK